MRYVAPLSAEERETLEEGVKNHKKYRFRDHCKGILMSADGHQVKEIANFFKVGTRTVYSWFDRWEKRGIVGLMAVPGQGVQAKLDHINEEEAQQVKECLKANPQNLKQVSQELSLKLGFQVTLDMLKRYIKKSL